ncbi:hypothetical protein BJ912DRAFT_1100183 [Pholiota molesta]|nr:hypothetical protein BJ912DRAFT_1100183 [Pholiota molesta]
MGFTQLLPTTTKARLALVGGLTAIYIIFSTVYMRYGAAYDKWTPSNGNGTTPTGDAPASTHSRILLVSAFFPLNTSKITEAEYDMWLTSFLQTSPESDPAPRHQLHLHLRHSALKGKEDMYTRIELRTGNAAPFYRVAAVSTLAKGGVNYDYAFWNDALSFHREHAYQDWPSFERVDKIWEDGARATAMNKADLFFVPTWDLPHVTMALWNEGLGPVDSKYTETSFFGGPPAAVDWWARAFYAYHDHFLALELFVGKDQALANTLALLFAPRLLTVWANDPRAPAHVALLSSSPGRTPAQSFLGQCGAEWFYYQFLMASEAERERMRERWVAEAGGWWGWWSARHTEPCRGRGAGHERGAADAVWGGVEFAGGGGAGPGSVSWRLMDMDLALVLRMDYLLICLFVTIFATLCYKI